MTPFEAPSAEVDWVQVGPAPLPVVEALAWATLPGCGATVTFSGTVRDHSTDRPGVVTLEYETYPEHVEASISGVVADVRRRWPTVGRVAALHRTGLLRLSEVAVLVVVSAPHRGEAFEAARFCIDSLKATAPIWKRETWAGGTDWGRCHHVDPALDPAAAPAAEHA